MLSQFFILSSRGDTIAFRDYRGDVVKGTADIFYRKAKGWKGSQAPPIFNVEGVHFIHIKRSGLYFVFTTKFNVSPAFVIETLNRLCNLFKDYCGILNEESLRLNFVLIYELLDEVLDFGYPQVLSTETLKTHVHNQPVPVEMEKQHHASFIGSSGPASNQKSVPSFAANKPIAVSLEQQRAQKNEIFVDLLERLTVLIGADGTVLRAEVAGCLQMKSFLAHSSEVRLGLNEDLVIGNTDRGSGSLGVTLDDCSFHEAVNLEEFERDRVVSIMPPDGESTLMNYRVSGDFRNTLPFNVFPLVEEGESARSSVDISLTLRCNLPSNCHAMNITVRIPVPKSTTRVSQELGASQTMEYKALEKSILWKMKKISSHAEQHAKFKVSVSEKSKTTRKEIGPLSIDFEIPMFVCSGLNIRFLRVFERSGSYSPFRWVRYITHSDSYVIRI
ncbi:uncharacterized protein LOC134191864 [Corticium candelabrum]|uniref:uncharacterized protein LOC134191864 n=1 Tax=Corticium candelabrum TaxID=121492 RepID=UPI002E2557E2|nr:uncharacterized protein LOC134191864 [Corticium candelabrum]